jgi:hypothetical protein
MGFSALDGMPMGTRSGQLDPGVILHFLDKGMSAGEITALLYKQSGLLGLSGLSHDMRTLQNSDMKSALEAIDYYTFRLRREIGAMAAVLGGLDALVFTGGIGENSAEIRARASNLAFLGLSLDPTANAETPPASTRAPSRSSSCPPTRNASSRAPRPPRWPDPLHLSKNTGGRARGQRPHRACHTSVTPVWFTHTKPGNHHDQTTQRNTSRPRGRARHQFHPRPLHRGRTGEHPAQLHAGRLFLHHAVLRPGQHRASASSPTSPPSPGSGPRITRSTAPACTISCTAPPITGPTRNMTRRSSPIAKAAGR